MEIKEYNTPKEALDAMEMIGNYAYRLSEHKFEFNLYKERCKSTEDLLVEVDKLDVFIEESSSTLYEMEKMASNLVRYFITDMEIYSVCRFKRGFNKLNKEFTKAREYLTSICFILEPRLEGQTKDQILAGICDEYKMRRAKVGYKVALGELETASRLGL